MRFCNDLNNLHFHPGQEFSQPDIALYYFPSSFWWNSIHQCYFVGSILKCKSLHLQSHQLHFSSTLLLSWHLFLPVSLINKWLDKFFKFINSTSSASQLMIYNIMIIMIWLMDYWFIHTSRVRFNWLEILAKIIFIFIV